MRSNIESVKVTPGSLLVVDGDNLAHRAYHSTPKTIVGKDNQPVNAISGFFSMLLRITLELSPRQIFVAWDTLGVDTYRNKLWPAYQTGRVFEREIVTQLNMLPSICREFGFGVGKESGYEADDLMASAALLEVERGGSALVFTTDKDSYQLVSDRITIVSPKRGSRELDVITPEEVVARMGVLPSQVPDYKALMGDSSDKIPGIRGIGPKAASALLLKHGCLEEVIEAWENEENKQLSMLFRDVCTMRTDAKVELPTSSANWEKGAEYLRNLGLEGLSDRILSQIGFLS